MDILQVLEGLAYVGFIAGAIFAVMELRDIKKDRRLDVMLRMEEMTSNREFTEATCRLWRSKETTAEGLEKEVSLVDLTMLADYLESMAELATDGLVDEKLVTGILPFGGIWKKMSPWILAVRRETGYPEMFGDFEKLAQKELAEAGD